MRTTDDPKDKVYRMRVSDTFLELVDNWRKNQPNQPSRAEAIRQLCEWAIKIQSGPPK